MSRFFFGFFFSSSRSEKLPLKYLIQYVMTILTNMCMGWYEVGRNSAAGTTKGTASGSWVVRPSWGEEIAGLLVWGLSSLSPSSPSLVSSPASMVATWLVLRTEVRGTLLTKLIISSWNDRKKEGKVERRRNKTHSYQPSNLHLAV